MSLAGWISIRPLKDRYQLFIKGHWVLDSSAQIEQEIMDVHCGKWTNVEIILDQIVDMDTAGAWMLKKLISRLEEEERDIEVIDADEAYKNLIYSLPDISIHQNHLPTIIVRLAQKFEELGITIWRAAVNFFEILSFVGLVISHIGRALSNPKRLRVSSLIHYIDHAGIDALPINALMSFMIGIVVAYVGLIELTALGATSLVPNMIQAGVLRDVGVLFSAVLITGRTGSAYTSEIGIMKMNDEIDALKTLGLNEIDVLVVPKVLALVFFMPLLVFWADVMGLIGGGLVLMLSLDYSLSQVINAYSNTITFHNFMVGMTKAPFFAFIIGLVGCFEGFRVECNADSIAKKTTQSVVEALFFIILLDALFVIFFSMLGI